MRNGVIRHSPELLLSGRQGSGLAARAIGALAQVLGRRLVDALGPTALERVANREAESAHALYAHLDGVAVLHRAEALVVGAHEEHVAGADLLDSRHDQLRQGSGN